MTDEQPELLLVYMHTMYLAIFSGGFILKKLIVNSLGLRSGDGGVSSFELPPEVSRLTLKNHLKKTMDSFELSRDIKDRMIQEKLVIFRRNNKLAASINPTWSSGKRILKLFVIGSAFVFGTYYIIAHMVRKT